MGAGSRGPLDQLESALRAKFECKCQRLGWSNGRARTARVLGRIITLTEQGIEIEADPKLVETIVHSYGLENCGKVIDTPAVKLEEKEALTSQELLQRRTDAGKKKQHYGAT